jgi:hypothetical protein
VHSVLVNRRPQSALEVERDRLLVWSIRRERVKQPDLEDSLVRILKHRDDMPGGDNPPAFLNFDDES